VSDSSIDPQKASALFASMIVQQTNMALIFLGRTPNPQTGEMVEDLHTARMLIDQLEMLAVKTRGNLDPREAALLNQSLTAVRMAFVEAVEHGPSIQKRTEGPKGEAAAPKTESPAAATQSGESSQATSAAPAPETGAASAQGESHKKFSKKY